MRLEQLMYLLAINKYQSMSVSGTSLHVSQQAISVAVSQLEQEVGVKLVIRNRRGSYLTKEGEEIAAFGDRLFHEWAELVDKYQARVTGSIQEATIYMSPQFRINPNLTHLLTYCRSQTPAFQVTIKNCTISEIICKVENDPEIIGMMMLLERDLPSIPANLHQFIMSTHHLGVMVHKDSPLAKRGKVSLKTLRNTDILVIHEKNAPENVLMGCIQQYELEKHNRVLYNVPVDICSDYVKHNYGVMLSIFFEENFAEDEIGAEMVKRQTKEDIRAMAVCVSQSEAHLRTIAKAFWRGRGH